MAAPDILTLIEAGDVDAVGRLVDDGLDPNAPVGENGDLVRLLVDAGTPVDIVDDTYGNTPLGWVLLDGDDDMAALLVLLGADRATAIS